MKYNQLAEVIISSLSSKPTNHTIGKSQEGLPRLLTFNFKPSSYCIVINKELMLNAKENKMVEGNFQVVKEIRNILSEQLENEIEFIHEDQITKSLTILTKDYVDELLDGSELLGDLILNYFKIWYISKVGPEAPLGAESFATENQTFSIKERNLLNSLYMPIISVPKDLKPVYDTMKTVVEISAIREYVLIEPAYNVYGKRSDGVTFWIPRNIAKEFLKESDVENVLSIEIVKKLLKDAGLLGGAPIETHEEIAAGKIHDISDEQINRFILDQQLLKEQQRDAELKTFISSDVDIHDNKISKDAKLPTFDI